MRHPHELTIEIHCHNLPGCRFEDKAGVRLGIQCGAAVIDDVAGDAPHIIFTIPIRVSEHAKTGRPNFLGPYVHGTPEARFIYLSWGERDGDQWSMFRRAKLHLNHLGLDDIERAVAEGQPLKVAIDMTDAGGGPLCASIKPDRLQWQM